MFLIIDLKNVGIIYKGIFLSVWAFLLFRASPISLHQDDSFWTKYLIRKKCLNLQL